MTKRIFRSILGVSLAVLLASRQWKKKEHFRYPEDRVMIG